MNRKVRKTLNFFAFNILFFAIYLNFIHKDSPDPTLEQVNTTTTVTSYKPTVAVQQPVEKKADPVVKGNIN